LLLSADANPNIRDNWGETPLIKAAERGKVETVKVFIYL
jgi:ankyrin repeat protein